MWEILLRDIKMELESKKKSWEAERKFVDFQRFLDFHLITLIQDEVDSIWNDFYLILDKFSQKVLALNHMPFLYLSWELFKLHDSSQTKYFLVISLKNFMQSPSI